MRDSVDWREVIRRDFVGHRGQRDGRGMGEIKGTLEAGVKDDSVEGGVRGCDTGGGGGGGGNLVFTHWKGGWKPGVVVGG